MVSSAAHLWTVSALIAAVVIGCGGRSSSSASEPPPTKECSALADARITYVAVTTDRHYVVVIGDRNADVRVFYGMPAHMAEGRITGTENSCAHEVSFLLDAMSYRATLSPGFDHCPIPSTLDIGEPGSLTTRVALTVINFLGDVDQRDAGVAQPGSQFTFFCR
jgi:hypothetical protein